MNNNSKEMECGDNVEWEKRMERFTPMGMEKRVERSNNMEKQW